MYGERGQASSVMSQHPYNPNNLLMKRQVPWVIIFKVTGAHCTDSRKKYMSISFSQLVLDLYYWYLLQLMIVKYM